MSYEATPGPPNLQMALALGDPKHCTRGRQKPRRSDHISLDDSAFDGATEVFKEFSKEHNSTNVYYALKHPVDANCTVLPVTDDRIVWRYCNKSARQSARPYIKGLVHKPTMFAKRSFDAEDKAKVRTQHSVPPELVPKFEGDAVPPGDPIALWNRIKMTGLDDSAIIGVLCGGHVCVYSF